MIFSNGLIGKYYLSIGDGCRGHCVSDSFLVRMSADVLLTACSSLLSLQYFMWTSSVVNQSLSLELSSWLRKLSQIHRHNSSPIARCHIIVGILSSQFQDSWDR